MKKTVQQNFREQLKIQGRECPWNLPLMSWNEFNRKVETIWENGGETRFIGADQDKNGRMMACFQDTDGNIYCVDNDVVFQFQKDGKPIEKRL